MDTQREMLGHANPMKKTDGIVPPQNGAALAKERARRLPHREKSQIGRRFSPVLVAAIVVALFVGVVGVAQLHKLNQMQPVELSERPSSEYFQARKTLKVGGVEVTFAEVVVPKGNILAVRYPYSPVDIGYRERLLFMSGEATSGDYLVEYEDAPNTSWSKLMDDGRIRQVTRLSERNTPEPRPTSSPEWGDIASNGLPVGTSLLTLYVEAQKVLNNPVETPTARMNVVQALVRTGVTVEQESIAGKRFLRLTQDPSKVPPGDQSAQSGEEYISLTIDPNTGFGEYAANLRPTRFDAVPISVVTAFDKAIARQDGSCSTTDRGVECRVP